MKNQLINSSASELLTNDLIREQGRIKLLPLVIWRIKKDDYNVIRIGCRAITVIGTHRIGVEAIRLWQKGRSLGQTKSILGSRHGYPPEQIDLTPLIKTLLKAKMVQSIDEEIIEPEEPNTLRLLYHYLRCCLNAVGLAATIATIKYLPVGVAHWLLFFFQAARRRRKSQQLRARARDNLRRVFGAALEEERIETLASHYEQEMIRCEIDARCLREMSAPKIARWLKNSVELSGQEYFNRARTEGRGVILCGFHFSSQFLLPLILWLRGYSFTVIGLIGRISEEEKFRSGYELINRQIPGCGEVKWFATLDLKSVLEIRKVLSQGGVVLLFADAYVKALNRPGNDAARYFGHTIAEYLPARTRVKLLGQPIAANKGVAWLRVQTGTPVVPIKLLRQTSTKYRLIIEPQLNLDGEASIEAVVAAIYQALERDIYLHPGQWLYWSELHKMSVSTEGSAGIPGVDELRQSDWATQDEAIAELFPSTQPEVLNPTKKEVRLWRTGN